MAVNSPLQCYTAVVAQWLECPPRKREVKGLIPGRVKPKIVKLELDASLLGAQH